MTSDAEVKEAKELAERLLSGNRERLAHSAAVAHRAEFLAVGVTPARRAELVAAAWLHDIGYSEACSRPPSTRSTAPATFGSVDGVRRCTTRLPTTPEADSSPSCEGSSPI